MPQSSVSPGTVVFLFALRYDDEPASAATNCRFIAAPGYVKPSGERFYNEEIYEVEVPDRTGQPRWSALDEKPPNALMTEVFNRLASGSRGGSVGVVSLAEAANGVRTIDLGMITIRRTV